MAENRPAEGLILDTSERAWSKFKTKALKKLRHIVDVYDLYLLIDWRWWLDKWALMLLILAFARPVPFMFIFIAAWIISAALKI